MTPWFAPLWGLLAGNYRRAGHRLKAEALLMLPRVVSVTGHPIAEMTRASYHVVNGEFDRAAPYLEKAMEARHYLAGIVAWSPLYKDFRETPQGREFLAKMNLGTNI